ncbi:MAG TPA: class I SAM-dependent methyltransferase [Gemmataceae bacterium]|nr:class I SAM-dependent methyltransferase [Gemmataceae bacterium]
MNPYRCRVLDLFRACLQPLAPVNRGLDFGAGDGWFASSFVREGIAHEVVAIDVQVRPRTFTEVILYDGQRLPFADRSFDLVSSVDVLHHCPDPQASLREALRCAARFFLLKDHTYRSLAGRLTLCALDEIGNRRFGIPSLYRYQKRWDWFPVIEEAGFTLCRLIHPAPCHVGPLGWATNSLQFIGLWERTSS